MVLKKFLSIFAAMPLILCGCAGGETPAMETSGEATTSAEQSETAETTTSAETAEASAEATESSAEIAVTYPCLYSSEEKTCTFDDNEIYGNLYIPQNGRETHPAVILSHGYNSAGTDMTDMAKEFAENGIIAYTYDFRGGSTRSKSSGSSHDMSVETEQDDLRHVIDMIMSLDESDDSRIYLYGESQGGFVSALTGAEMSDKIAGMFLIYPAFCIPDDWLDRDPETMTEPFNFMGLEISKAFFDGVPRYDVFEHVSKFENPVLIFHGDKDAVVNLSYSEKLTESFADVKLTVVEGGGHGFSGPDRLMMRKSIIEFFEENGLN